jgi:uncharacterized protein YjaZ
MLVNTERMAISFSYKLTDTNIYAQLLYRIHSGDAQKLDQAGVLDVVRKAVRKQNAYLQHKECNILIFADTFGVIPEQGVGGRCNGFDIVNIFIDPSHKSGLKHNVKTWLPSALAHELYHARRYVTHPFGATLGQALVDEGLPAIFEEFMEPSLEVPYAHYLTRQELVKSWEKAKKVLHNKGYDHDDWFYGGGGIKRWTGYSLGYDIVRQFMQKKGANNPAALIDIPAKDFLRHYNPQDAAV